MQAISVGNFPFATRAGKSDKSAMANSVLVQRVEHRLAELRLGPVEAASRVEGLERNYIRDLLQGKKQSFSASKIELVAQALDWTAAQLRDEPQKVERQQTRVIRVPLLDGVPAGKLASPASQVPQDQAPRLAFGGLGRGDFFALTVEGDSMDRISPEGSVIVINRAEQTLISGKCYVFSIKGETTFKRWQADEPPYLDPYSTNPIHKPRIIKQKTGLTVLGRVRRTVLDL